MLAARMLHARPIRTRGHRHGVPTRGPARGPRGRACAWIVRVALALALGAPVLEALAAGPAGPPTSDPPTPGPAQGSTAPRGRPARLSERRPTRRWALGIEGVALQIPPLRPRVAALDGRYLGASATLGGFGALARVRVVPEVALELAVRSGSLRYRSDGDLISQDLLLAELGVLLYLARGDVGHVAVDAGLGGLGHAIRYDLADGRAGRQLVGGASVHVGVDLELLLGRVALAFSLRSHGVVTDVGRTRATGPLFAGASTRDRQAPLPRFQTYLLGAVGLLYRF